MPKLIMLLPSLGVGLVVGVMSGLFGIGGGILMVPALYYLWRQDMQTAVGTSLAVMIPTALAGTIRNSSFGTVDWRVAALFAIGGILGTYLIGAPLAQHIPSEVLKRLFGVLTAIMGLHMAGAGELISRLWK